MANDDTGTDLVAQSPFGGAVDIVDPEALAAALEDTQNEGGRDGDQSYISFSGKLGRYKIGADAREPGENEPWLLNIAGFELGWMCWKGGQPIAKRMANIQAPRVPTPNLEEGGPFDTNKGEGWAKARALTLKSLENDEQGYFTNNSKSGVAAMSDLQKEVTGRLKSGQEPWPVVILKMEQFESQGFKNYKPVFEVIAWLSMDEVKKLSDPDAEPMEVFNALMSEGAQEEAPAPTPKRRRL